MVQRAHGVAVCFIGGFSGLIMTCVCVWVWRGGVGVGVGVCGYMSGASVDGEFNILISCLCWWCTSLSYHPTRQSDWMA